MNRPAGPEPTADPPTADGKGFVRIGVARPHGIWLDARVMTGPENLTPATRRTALVVSRLMFYLGLMVGMLLLAGSATILFTSNVTFPSPAERWLTGGVFGGLAVMAFGFSAMGKARISKFKG